MRIVVTPSTAGAQEQARKENRNNCESVHDYSLSVLRCFLKQFHDCPRPGVHLGTATIRGGKM
jgi:hypothetical protein